MHKATKGNIRQSDLDKNSFGFDASWMDDDFLVDLSNGEINTTYLEPKSVLTRHLANKAVTEVKTTFIDTSTNLFDKSSIKRRTVLSFSDGSEQEDDLYSASDFIPIEDTKTYSWNGTRARFYYDDEYNFLSSATHFYL